MKTLQISYDNILKFRIDEETINIDDGFSESRESAVNILKALIKYRKDFNSVEVFFTDNEDINEILKLVKEITENFLNGYNKLNPESI